MTEQASPPRMSLYEAARKAGVTFTEEAKPEDKFVTLNSLKFHYLDWGNAHLKPMLCLHGGSQQAHSWDFFALGMRDQYHVISLDQRGHGDTDWHPEGHYSAEDHQNDLDEFTKAINLQQFTLVGLSMGGRNSYTFTARHPELIEALVICDVGPELNSVGTSHISQFTSGPDQFDSLDELAQHAYRYDPNRSLDQFRGSVVNSVKQLPSGKWTWKYDRRFRGQQGRGAMSNAEVVEQHWGFIKSIRCPTLIVRGGVSDVFTMEVAQRMQSLIPGSQVTEVPNAGHLVAGDNPAGFEKAVKKFLGALSS